MLPCKQFRQIQTYHRLLLRNRRNVQTQEARVEGLAKGVELAESSEDGELAEVVRALHGVHRVLRGRPALDLRLAHFEVGRVVLAQAQQVLEARGHSL